jgi:hypothetical protein
MMLISPSEGQREQGSNLDTKPFNEEADRRAGLSAASGKAYAICALFFVIRNLGQHGSFDFVGRFGLLFFLQ